MNKASQDTLDASKPFAEVFAGEIAALGGNDEVSDTALDAHAPDRALDGEVRAPTQRKLALTGLAFSGGGIRSAAFALGVFQSLMRFGIAERFHYLSTVSGGGYMGTAIAWLRKRYGNAWQAQLNRLDSGTRTNGAARAGAKTHIWLDYLRQHGNYLLPSSISPLALLGVALRNICISTSVYFGILVATLAALIRAGVLPRSDGRADHAESSLHLANFPGFSIWIQWDATSLALALALTMGIAFCAYSLSTFIGSFRRNYSIVLGLIALAIFVVLLGVGLGAAPVRVLDEHPRWAWGVLFAAAVATVGCLVLLSYAVLSYESDWLYRVRVSLQQKFGFFLALVLASALLAALPGLLQLFASTSHELATASSATLLGAIGAIYQATLGRSQGGNRSRWAQLRIAVTGALLILGTVVLAFWAAQHLAGQSLAIRVVAIVAVIALGWCTNLNLFGIGRMYRDRLMETFLPNKGAIERNCWTHATDADGDTHGNLAQIWPPQGFDTPRLYPLINTNVVLVDSRQDKYRGRGGDSFVLSPLYCGCNATDWIRTGAFADGNLKAATAMAISGAAANPNTGVGGRGITRDRLVSFLMFALQARLGVWVKNPRPSKPGLLRRIGRNLLDQRPNFLSPGIRSGLLGRNLNEHAHFLELTDGGHFDNTGAYELIRRRARLIVLSQAGADPDYQLGDLANLIEKVRVDFAAMIDFIEGADTDLNGLVPRMPGGLTGKLKYADRGYAIARITYASSETADNDYGWLVYLQATPIRDVPTDVLSYHEGNPDYPNQTTADQFFDEAQLEAYRELGYYIAKQCFGMLKDLVPAAPNASRDLLEIRRLCGL